MHALLVVPDGVGVRNFVLGRFLDELDAADRVTVLHTLSDDLLATYSDVAGRGRIEWHPLETYRETPVTATLRYSLAYAQMHWVGTASMRLNSSRSIPGSWRTKAVHAVAKATGRIAAFPRAIRTLDAWHCRAIAQLPAVREYSWLFERIRPTVLFCSHQRPPIVLPAVLAARALGIPTATFIFSWDNLSSKGRIAAPFDHYLVWSDLMRRELLRFYPDVSPDRVHVVGTPQFDPYADASLVSTRDEFFAEIGADPRRKLICYSGGDTGNCPEDQHHVEILMSLIRSRRVAGDPQVLLRPSPVDQGTRYDAVRARYPELIYEPPAWVHTDPGNWAQVFPLAADLRMLGNLTRHSDLNINFGSTMSLDFALRDKPVINVVIDVTRPYVHGMPLMDFCMAFEHYRPVAELGAVRFARSADELASFVNDYLADPARDREGRRRLVDLQVMTPLGGSSRRILDVLGRIGRRAGAAPRTAAAPSLEALPT